MDSWYEYRDVKSDRCLVCFAGVHSGSSIAPFEFASITRALNVNVILLRDLEQYWYSKFYKSDVITPEWISTIFERPQRISLVGNSMGGFGALLLAEKLKAKNVLAISPQTNISVPWLIKGGNIRYLFPLLSMYRNIGWSKSFYDLKNVLDKNNEFKIHLIAGEENKFDLRHVDNIAEYADKISIIKGAGHNAVRVLKQNKSLLKFLKSTMS